ncbi:MAG: penicillin-binding protein 2 [Patescibacteria group bacterium]
MAASKLFFVQIINGDKYTKAADRQYAASSLEVFERGSIFFTDRSGELVPAATLGTGFFLAIEPNKITDPDKIYEALSGIVAINHDDFFKKASKTGDPYEEILHRMNKDQADAIDALSIPGVKVYREKWRLYPWNEIGSRTIGFIGYREGGNFLEGRYGVERYYEDILSRKNSDLYANFFVEIFSNLKEGIISGGRSEGDVILNIEPEAEKTLHNELKRVHEEYSSDFTGGVIMDPKTGAIYAMDAVPGFDPNDLRSVKDTALFGNPLVEGVYEMGSIVKPLTMAAALDAGVVTRETTYRDDGFVIVEDARIKNFDGKGRGVVNMQEVISQSLNTGMVFVEKRLGNNKFRSYMKKFGVGEETGVDLPGEVAGLADNLNSTRDVEYATASFGQGIAFTPIQIARALSAVANGGYLIEPHVINRISYKGGFSRKPSYSGNDEKIISSKASEEMTRMLVEFVDKALLGGTVKNKDYSIAAKTGTAQMAKEDGRGYYEDRYLHSFFGYFPAYDPRFLVFLYTVNPKGVNYASHTLTYPFMRITSFLLNYYQIPPDRSPKQ